jgi:hypothetical protein
VALSDSDAWHVAFGRPFVRVAGAEHEDLENSLDDWRTAWERHRETVLAWWKKGHVGSRPPAWWRFDARQDEPDNDGDAPEEIETLYELGAFCDGELEAIREHALRHIEFNRGRSPHNPGTNFIPDHSGIVEFAIEHELLTPEECPEYF